MDDILPISVWTAVVITFFVTYRIRKRWAKRDVALAKFRKTKQALVLWRQEHEGYEYEDQFEEFHKLKKEHKEACDSLLKLNLSKKYLITILDQIDDEEAYIRFLAIIFNIKNNS